VAAEQAGGAAVGGGAACNFAFNLEFSVFRFLFSVKTPTRQHKGQPFIKREFFPQSVLLKIILETPSTSRKIAHLFILICSKSQLFRKQKTENNLPPNLLSQSRPLTPTKLKKECK
jgi:hypothetical protein